MGQVIRISSRKKGSRSNMLMVAKRHPCRVSSGEHVARFMASRPPSHAAPLRCVRRRRPPAMCRNFAGICLPISAEGRCTCRQRCVCLGWPRS
jgi:hypothetical protein